MMIDIIIVGEDAVTREISKRLLRHLRDDFQITREDPIRGGEIKNKILNYNRLNLPVFVLTDLDDIDCPPSLIKNWFNQTPKNPNLIFRVACDEAETWLMADKTGFSRFLGIKESDLPGLKQCDRRNPQNVELQFKYKPSLYLMRELAVKSNNKLLSEQLKPRLGAKKGPEYNTALIPFIQNNWDIESAAKNSYSLSKAIKRISEFSPYESH